MAIDAGAAPLVPMPLWPDARQVACLCAKATAQDDTRLLVLGLDEMKTLSGGGRGVTLIGLDDGEVLLQALPFGAAGVVLGGSGRGGKPQEEQLAGAALAPYVGKRARRGKAPAVKFKVERMRPALPPTAR
jgi:topoisomerase-4 subunit A